MRTLPWLTLFALLVAATMPQSKALRYGRISGSFELDGVAIPFDQFDAGQVFYTLDGTRTTKPLKLSKDFGDAVSLVTRDIKRRREAEPPPLEKVPPDEMRDAVGEGRRSSARSPDEICRRIFGVADTQ